MEHFSIIQSLCRLGLADGSNAFRRQVERLRDRLREDRDTPAVETLERLLTSSDKQASLVPSRVELSRAFLKGEALTESTQPPVDRETSTPIADIILSPRPDPMPPKLTPKNAEAVDALIEEWRNVGALSELGLRPPYSCLIFGPPGTGKTLTAFSIAERLGLPLVRARIDGIVSSFLGTTARNLGNLFDFANRYRCVLLLDEFDAIAKLRDDPHEVGEIKRVVNTLLQNLDSRQGLGLTVAITNHPSLLDTAIWRRFSIRLELSPPMIEQRISLLESFMQPVPVPPKYAKLMAWLTEGFSGSDLKAMTDTLKRHVALRGNGRDAHIEWLDALRAFAVRNSGISREQTIHLLLDDNTQTLAQRLADSTQPAFTQKEIGEILSIDQSTISRWASKRNRA